MKGETRNDGWSKFLKSTGAARNRRKAEAKRREKKEDKQDGGDGEDAYATEYIPQPSVGASLQASFDSKASCGNSTMRADTVFAGCGHEQPNVDGQYRLEPTIGQPGSISSHIYGFGDDSSSFLPHQEFPLGYSLYGSYHSIPLNGSASAASQGTLSWESQADSRVLYMPPGHPRPFGLPYQQYDPTHHTRSQVQYEENRGEGNYENILDLTTGSKRVYLYLFNIRFAWSTMYNTTSALFGSNSPCSRGSSCSSQRRLRWC